MYKIIKNGDNTNSGVAERIAGELTDIDTLPTNVSAGSSCICLENSSVWMLGNDKQWHQL
jgi:hypothetical protein